MSEQELETQVNELPSKEDLSKRFAEVQQLTPEDAEKLIGADTPEEILKNISAFTVAKINSQYRPRNRAERRKQAKKQGKNNVSRVEAVTDTAQKLNYIDLIQRLRTLNEKREQEGEVNYEDSTENN